MIYNRQTPIHHDRREPRIGWTPLFVMGRFVDGYLRIRQLGIRLWHGPGACVFMRGGILPHEVEEFKGGQRICVASFLHQSVWDDMEIIPRSSGISTKSVQKTRLPPPSSVKDNKGVSSSSTGTSSTLTVSSVDTQAVQAGDVQDESVDGDSIQLRRSSRVRKAPVRY